MTVRKWDPDKVGAFASTVCAVHCVLTGLALGLLSVAGLGFVASPAAEAAFFGFAFVLGVAALIHGRRKHHSRVPAAVFALGMVLLTSAHTVFEETAAHHWVSAAGGIALVAFHVLNARLGHRCGCDCAV